eukprot:6211749-Pleurochrysis_carterae.AAC.4
MQADMCMIVQHDDTAYRSAGNAPVGTGVEDLNSVPNLATEFLGPNPGLLGYYCLPTRFSCRFPAPRSRATLCSISVVRLAWSRHRRRCRRRRARLWEELRRTAAPGPTTTPPTKGCTASFYHSHT